MDEIALTREQSLDGIGQIPGNLAHPQSVCRSRDPADLHPPRRQLDKKENEKARSPLAVQTSIVKKSAATIISQCCARNSFQVVLRLRSGAGSMPLRFQNVGHSATCQITFERSAFGTKPAESQG